MASAPVVFKDVDDFSVKCSAALRASFLAVLDVMEKSEVPCDVSDARKDVEERGVKSSAQKEWNAFVWDLLLPEDDSDSDYEPEEGAGKAGDKRKRKGDKYDVVSKAAAGKGDVVADDEASESDYDEEEEEEAEESVEEEEEEDDE
jgi:hypothetical protein